MMQIRPWMALLLALWLTAGVAACGTPAEDTEPAENSYEITDDAVDDSADEADAGADEEMAEEAAADAVAAGALGSAENPIVMSFVPSGETSEVVTGSDEISALLQAETGLRVTSNVASSYAAVIEAMGAGQAQVGWLNTFSYLLANEKFGVQPILAAERFGTTAYASIIITRADSGIESLADLAGKKFCRPDPLSTSGWIVPSVDMKAAELDPDADLEVIDSGSHDNVVTAVYNGDCDAGAVYDDARTGLEDEFPDVMEQIAIIHTSDDIPNDNVSVGAEVPADIVALLIEGLIAIGETEEGAAALETAYGIEKLAPTDDAFYDAFRTTLDAAGVDVEELAQD